MSSFPSVILTILMCVNLFSATANNARRPVSPPIVVLEATRIVHGQGEKIQNMLVRLTDDGTVEWDKYVGNEWKRQTSSVSAERVSKIQRTLDSIDKNRLHGAMG